MPLWFEWYTTSQTAGSAPGDRVQVRYALYGPGGYELTSLYPVGATATHLGNLLACLELFASTETPALPPGWEQTLPDCLRRVLDILLPTRRRTQLGRRVRPPQPPRPVLLKAQRDGPVTGFHGR
ncbi:hypothetical protein ACWDE9_48490 [Streptomyces olivaceoviridis]